MVHNWEWYRVFYFTAKASSFTKAAEELHITQPAVTQVIKQLEANLGGPLFWRTSKGVKLTGEGEVLFRYIEQAYHLISNGEKKIAERHLLIDGELTIGAGDTLCRHFLLPYLERFHEAYPGIKLQVTNRTTLETVQLVKAGKLDFGIVHLPLNDKQLSIVECAELQDSVVAGMKYKALTQETLPMARLAEFPLILLEKGSNSRSYIDEWFSRGGEKIQPEIELGSIELIVEFVRRGFGLGIVPRQVILEELGRQELLEIATVPPIPPRSIGIAYLKEVPLTAAARQFIGGMTP